MTTFKKLVAGTLAALTLGLAVASSATPAAAGWRHYGPGLGIFGGLALGALAVGAIAGAPYGEDCYLTRQAFYDDYGNFIGYRRVRVCN
jgi:hypothetical protein